jgi:hypothetical protein
MATMTPAELATELSTDARTARKFLRSITPRDAQPGKGSRWAIEKKSLRSLRTKFVAFEKAQADAKALRDAAKVAEVVEVENDAPETADELETELEGPTDAELDAIEND